MGYPRRLVVGTRAKSANKSNKRKQMGSPVRLSQPSTLTTHYQCHHRAGADAVRAACECCEWAGLGALGRAWVCAYGGYLGGQWCREARSLTLLLYTVVEHGGARAVSTSMAACMRTRGRCRFARATLREAGQRAVVVAAMIWMVRRAGTISGFEKRRFVLSG